MGTQFPLQENSYSGLARLPSLARSLGWACRLSRVLRNSSVVHHPCQIGDMAPGVRVACKTAEAHIQPEGRSKGGLTWMVPLIGPGIREVWSGPPGILQCALFEIKKSGSINCHTEEKLLSSALSC